MSNLLFRLNKQKFFLNRITKTNKILLLALFLSFSFSLYGLHWGWVECWNPDQMAFRDLFHPDKIPFNPANFKKPPFHTYFNFFLSEVPFRIVRRIFHLSPDVFLSAKLLWSRSLTVFLFAGTIILSFQITKRFFGIFAAEIVVLIFATSAGFIVDSHFLTADIPVLFWMMLALYFTQNITFYGRRKDYVLAGLITGIATATKYNGLAIGITIVVSHILQLKSYTWKQILCSKNLLIGLCMVPMGFLIGNPFALIDYQTFINDFRYNYVIAPIFDGSTEPGQGYWKFLVNMQEIIGFPALIGSAIAVLFALFFLAIGRIRCREKQGIILLLAVFLLYYYKFGSFPRLPVRFVMPALPFWLILSGVFWQRLKSYKLAVATILCIIVTYNSISSFYVGKRFAEDPRMQAQAWVKDNIPPTASIDSDRYTPSWNLVSGIQLTDNRLAHVTGRRKIFEQIFPADAWVMKEIRKRQDDTDAVQGFTFTELMQRQPDYIAVDSIQYNRFLQEKPALLYPSMKKFYSELLEEKYPYKIVFDRTTPTLPKWIYPQKIEFVDNRIVILKKVND